MAKQRFEHYTDTCESGENMENVLKIYERQGWELVTAVRINNDGDYRLFFKRPYEAE